MTTIRRISKLNHPGILGDFIWPSGLSEFGRFNLIYGWNGTGKTTISNLFRALEHRTKPLNCEVVFDINGVNVRGQDFEQATIPIRVFNRDFVSANVFTTDGDVSPIFVLGGDSVLKQRELDDLKQDFADLEQRLRDARSESTNTATDLDTYCIAQARAIKEKLRSPDPSNQYNNYNKTGFRSRADEIVTNGDITVHRLGDTERDRLLARRLEQPKRKISELTYRIPALSTYARKASQLLKATVLSMTIQSLKDDQALSTWIREGLGLHRSHQANQCLFCEQPLPEDRIQRLNAHFNAEYENFLSSIDEQIEILQNESEAAEQAEVPHGTAFYEELTATYVTRRDEFTKARMTVKETLDSLVRDLEQKKMRPFEEVTSDVAVPQVGSDVVEKLNQVVKQHNAISEEFESRVSEARDYLEADSVAGVAEEYVRLKRAKENSRAAADQASGDFKHLQTSISRLEQTIMEHRRPAEELNKDLEKYLGHSDIQLTIKDTGYQITRNGTLATALSEGEMTAIALLYFLRTLEDTRFELRKGVVVLDDPVSSLDTNALYLAFGCIKERTQQGRTAFHPHTQPYSLQTSKKLVPSRKRAKKD